MIMDEYAARDLREATIVPQMGAGKKWEIVAPDLPVRAVP